MGCKDTILQYPLLKNHSVKKLPYAENTRKLLKDNLCHFKALVLHLHGNERYKKKLPIYSINSSKELVGLMLQTFEVFLWKLLQQ